MGASAAVVDTVACKARQASPTGREDRYVETDEKIIKGRQFVKKKFQKKLMDVKRK